MNSILKEINTLEHNEWDYYDRHVHYKLVKINDWNCQKEHESFIKEYLKIAGKSGIIDSFESKFIKFENFERKEHINSVFFLGCLFYKKLSLKNNIKFYREDKRDEFYFIWFLSSLVHDFGYYIEKNTEEYKKINEGIKSFIDFFEIDHNLLTENLNSNRNTKILTKNIPNYFKYRFNGRENGKSKIDHGIASGLILYNSLVKNRKKREQLNKEGVEKDGLYWGKELEKFYAIASNTIAIHNMHRISESNNVYEKYNLLELVMTQDNTNNSNITRISIEDEPLAFLFALADTIEPTKTFQSHKPDYVLENILISINEYEINLENKNNSKLDFSQFTKVVKQLETWVDVNINCPDENTIIIAINYKSK